VIGVSQSATAKVSGSWSRLEDRDRGPPYPAQPVPDPRRRREGTRTAGADHPGGLRPGQPAARASPPSADAAGHVRAPELGEAIALRRCDLDLAVRTVGIRRQCAETSGSLVIAQPKSRIGTRTVASRRRSYSCCVSTSMSMSGPRAPRWCSQGGGPGAEARQFSGRGSGWSDAAVAIGTLGLHFHDLRHTKTCWRRRSRRAPARRQGSCAAPDGQADAFPSGVWRAPSVETCLRETDQPVAHASGG
jgi:hypothetical protein